MIQPSKKGGESIFVDGYTVLETIRDTDIEAFETLCTTEFGFRCMDDCTGWHLESRFSIVRCNKGNGVKGDKHERFGEIVQIRHNDLDRLPTIPPHDMLIRGDDKEIEDFYIRVNHALGLFDSLLSSDVYRQVIPLQVGEMVAVSNQRVLHGRTSFLVAHDSNRSVSGCYVSQDDLDSRTRMEFDYSAICRG